ncbi:MAG TPA: hypothetical protein VF389_10310 [Woeseiaceae bacterium]
MDDTSNEWGILATILGLAMVLLIFGSALWFVYSAGRTNRKFRWLQLFSRRNRRQQPSGVDDAGGGGNRRY